MDHLLPYLLLVAPDACRFSLGHQYMSEMCPRSEVIDRFNQSQKMSYWEHVAE